jgi:hypothetical protein
MSMEKVANGQQGYWAGFSAQKQGQCVNDGPDFCTRASGQCYCCLTSELMNFLLMGVGTLSIYSNG